MKLSGRFPGTMLQTRPPDKVPVDEAIQIGHVLRLELIPSLIVEQHALTDQKLVKMYVYDWLYDCINICTLICEIFHPKSPCLVMYPDFLLALAAAFRDMFLDKLQRYLVFDSDACWFATATQEVQIASCNCLIKYNIKFNQSYIYELPDSDIFYIFCTSFFTCARPLWDQAPTPQNWGTSIWGTGVIKTSTRVSNRRQTQSSFSVLSGARRSNNQAPKHWTYSQTFLASMLPINVTKIC